MRFRAKVLTASMAVDVVDVDADNRDEAARFIASSGGKVLHLQEMSAGVLGSRWKPAFNLPVFNQQLHSLLEAGQTVVDAVEVLGHNDKGRHAAVYESLLTSLQQGKQLSDAMESLPSVFPPLYVAMVRSSETTGNVRSAIKRFMLYQQQVGEIRRKLVAASIYPAILIIVGFIVIGFLMLYVVPRFSAVFDELGPQKAQSARFIALWGGFVKQHAIVAWSLFLGTIVAIPLMVFHPPVQRYFQSKVLGMPWIGEKVWLLQLARLYRTLSMLLRSGVSILAAMKMAENTLPAAMGGKLKIAAQAVSEGRTISSATSEQELTTEVAHRLLVAGESSGNLGEMMERIADFYDQEISTWIDTAGRLIEPILMVVIGLVIGVVVLMLYTPIFDLANSI